MTFVPVNPGGWAVEEDLFSAQMNQLQDQMTKAVDGFDGGTYPLNSPLVLDGTVTITTLNFTTLSGDSLTLTTLLDIDGAAVNCEGTTFTGSCTFVGDVDFVGDVTISGDLDVAQRLTPEKFSDPGAGVSLFPIFPQLRIPASDPISLSSLGISSIGGDGCQTFNSLVEHDAFMMAANSSVTYAASFDGGTTWSQVATDVAATSQDESARIKCGVGAEAMIAPRNAAGDDPTGFIGCTRANAVAGTFEKVTIDKTGITSGTVRAFVQVNYTHGVMTTTGETTVWYIFGSDASVLEPGYRAANLVTGNNTFVAETGTGVVGAGSQVRSAHAGPVDSSGNAGVVVTTDDQFIHFTIAGSTTWARMDMVAITGFTAAQCEYVAAGYMKALDRWMFVPKQIGTPSAARGPVVLVSPTNLGSSTPSDYEIHTLSTSQPDIPGTGSSATSGFSFDNEENHVFSGDWFHSASTTDGDWICTRDGINWFTFTHYSVSSDTPSETISFGAHLGRIYQIAGSKNLTGAADYCSILMSPQTSAPRRAWS